MYNINLLDNESIKENYDFVMIEANQNLKEVSIIITNQRFIVLEDINKSYYKESFQLATASSNIPKYEIIYETLLDNIIDVKHSESNTYIEFKDKNKLIIYKLTILKWSFFLNGGDSC